MVSEILQRSSNGQSGSEALIPVRLQFYKTGILQFISHLDLTRTMTHALMRSEIPLQFSAGFNPHPKMVFSLPLSIGVESEREYLDFKLTAPMKFDTLKEQVNAMLPSMLQITEVRMQDMKLTAISYAAYALRIQHPSASEALASQLEDLYHSEMVVRKRSKSGEKEVDVVPFMRGTAVKYEADTKTILIHTKLCADNEKYLNPEYLIRGAEKYLSLSFDDPFQSGYRILRRELYCADGVTVFH